MVCWRGGGDMALVSDCLPLAEPIGLSPLLCWGGGGGRALKCCCSPGTWWHRLSVCAFIVLQHIYSSVCTSAMCVCVCVCVGGSFIIDIRLQQSLVGW